MTVKHCLDKFYVSNNIPPDGGSEESTFQMKFGTFSLTLPNPKFRREVTHIHDIHHVLNNCDTSWKGEGFIAGWEISTGIWRYLPVGLLSLWAMGYSIWLHPKSVYQGYVRGKSQFDILGLEYSKEVLLNMELDKLRDRVAKPDTLSTTSTLFSFLFWGLISQIFLLSPLILVLLLMLTLF